MADLITGFNTSIQVKHQNEKIRASQFLTFLLSNKLYAVGILDVKEVLEPCEITEIPMSPDYIRGVINLRGNVVPVIDLAVRMGHANKDISNRSCIVLVEISIHEGTAQTIGMLVDQVSGIVEIEPANILPAPEMGESVHTEFIQAMGRVEDSFIILLDINKILSVEQVSQLGELAEHGASMLPPTDSVH